MTYADGAWIVAQPFGLVLVALFIIWRPWRDEPPAFAPWALPLMIGLAYPLGRYAISGLPSFPASSADEWLVLFAAVAGIWAILESRFSTLSRGGIAFARTAHVAGLIWLMVGGHIELINLGFLVVAIASAVALLARASRDQPASLPLWAVATVAMAASPILLWGASFRLALMSAVLGATAGAAALVVATFRIGHRLHLAPAVMPLVALLSGLLISGVRFAMAPFMSALILGVALIVPLACYRRKPEKKGLNLRYAMTLGAVILLSGAAVGQAYRETQIDAGRGASQADEQSDNQSEESDDYDDPYTW